MTNVERNQSVDDGAAPDIENFSDVEVRERFSKSAINLFFGFIERWNIASDDMAELAGGVHRHTLVNWRKNHPTLSRDQLERISLILGIHKAIRLIFKNHDDAIRWMKSANEDTIFNGRAPLETMVNDGIVGLYKVRQYLDEWRGGR